MEIDEKTKTKTGRTLRICRISVQSGGDEGACESKNWQLVNETPREDDAHLQRIYEQCISRGATVSYKGLTRDHSKFDVAARSPIQGVARRDCQFSVPYSPDAPVSGELNPMIYKRAGGDYKPRTQYPSETTGTLPADKTHPDHSKTRRYVHGLGCFPRHFSAQPTPLQDRLFAVRRSKADQICWDCSRWTC
jgi:hypothetical protein